MSLGGGPTQLVQVQIGKRRGDGLADIWDEHVSRGPERTRAQGIIIARKL